ncbi:FKBP-type peptidyl-prolyl cis-trans isomerase [Oleiagrimonas sp.]|uniref:FKBP-type peptidyl-prolyl cis-trans isomerase n=1 Tax=Oleiagrimonas sp. TaxID=2010330 RepID=UPI00261234FC|nr:FKBP-type peptidyl-prolyl cis-trans isomerase [Oleiagrimonas sp.]MDA3912980.1 FKBP-type peptidyl-prolyl cis-trans isomerase [Oleiagrimonas sp.]
MRKSIVLVLLAVMLVSCGRAPKVHMSGHVDSLGIIDHTVGSGRVARPGMDVLVQYTGWLYDKDAPHDHGTRFDSSRDRSAPFSFVLGKGQVIAGWDKGIVGMRVGGTRTLMIPAKLAYGERGAGGVIPPGASLVFDVELVDATPR